MKWFWTKQPQPKERPAPPKLVVLCPKIKDACVWEMIERAKESMGRAQTYASKNGAANAPIAILFSEDALKYRFDICAQEVEEKILPLQKHLQTLNKEVVVVFSVLERRINEIDRLIEIGLGMRVDEFGGEKEKHLEHAHNSVYLLWADAMRSQAKRYLTDGDIKAIKKHWEGDSKQQYQVWLTRGEHMIESRIAFPQHRLENGVIIEARACADVWAGPIVTNEDMVSLIPASGLDLKLAKGLANERAAVVIHDREEIGEDTHVRNNILTCGQSLLQHESVNNNGVYLKRI